MSERDNTSEQPEEFSTEAVAAPTIAPNPALLAARDQARSALAEITDAASIGGDAGFEVHDEITVTLFFECTLPGYPGWRWAAALSKVDDESPVNVLEVELLPGEGAVLAPEWVPWSERLSQYREAQARHAEEDAEAAERAAGDLSDHDDDLDDADLDDDLEDDDFDADIDDSDVDDDDDDADDDADEELEDDLDDDLDDDSDLEEDDDESDHEEPDSDDDADDDEGADDDTDDDTDDDEPSRSRV